MLSEGCLERHRWCLAALGLICSAFFLAKQAAAAPLMTLIFCCGMLIAGVLYRTPGLLSVFAAAFLNDLFFDDQFPWTLFFAQSSVFITSLLANALLAPEKEEEPADPLLYLPHAVPFAKTVHVEIKEEIPIAPVETILQETPPQLPQEEPTENLVRLNQLNEARVALWEKELLLQHLLEEKKKMAAPIEEQVEAVEEEVVEECQESVPLHPAQIAYRELRKQFAEKSDAFHRLRQQMFDLESELIVLQRQREEFEGEKTEQIAKLMQELGEAEQDLEWQEEYILSLHNYLKFPEPKRPVRRKKPEAKNESQTELFEVASRTSTLSRNRRKRTTSAVYFGDINPN